MYTTWYFTEWKQRYVVDTVLWEPALYLFHIVRCMLKCETDLECWFEILEYGQGAAALKCLFIPRELVGDVNRISDTLTVFFQHQVLTLGLYDVHTSYLWHLFRHKLLNLPLGNTCQQAACCYVCAFHEGIGHFRQQIQFITWFQYIHLKNDFDSAGLSFI